MNELMKSFYTQFTDKQLTSSDYQDMVDMYGTDMQAFVRDFEKKYITPQGQEFNKDFYEELTNYEKTLRAPTPITEDKTVEGVDVPEYKPTTLKYIEQPVNQWLENQDNFFTSVENDNHYNMLKNAYEPFGFKINDISKTTAAKAPGATEQEIDTAVGFLGQLEMVAPNGEDKFTINIKDPNAQKELIEFTNKHAPKKGTPEYKEGQRKRELMFGVGLNYINETALSNKDKQEINAFIDNPDLFVRPWIKMDNALDGTGPRGGQKVLGPQPYQFELTQAEDELRKENPEFQKFDTQGKFIEIPRDQVEARAREMIKMNEIKAKKDKKEQRFIDANLGELEDRNVAGLGSILARNQLSKEELNIVKKQDQLALNIQLYDNNSAFIKKFQDEKFQSIIPEGEDVEMVELRNGNTVSKIDLERYQEAIKENVFNINKIKADRDELSQYYKIQESGISADMLKRDWRLTSMFSKLLTAEVIDGAYGMLRYPLGWAMHITPDMVDKGFGFSEAIKKADIDVTNFTGNLRQSVRPVQTVQSPKEFLTNSKEENAAFFVQGTSQMLPFMAFTMVGGSGARMLASSLGASAVTAGRVATAARYSSMVANIGGRKMAEFTVEEEANPWSEKHSLLYKNMYATAYALPEAIFEGLTTIRFLRNIGKANRLKLIGKKQNLYNVIKSRLKGGYGFYPLQEGGAEWLTELFQNGIEGRDPFENTTHAGLTGLLMGFGMGGFEMMQGYLHQQLFDSEKLKVFNKESGEEFVELDNKINRLKRIIDPKNRFASDKAKQEAEAELKKLTKRQEQLSKEFDKHFDDVFDNLNLNDREYDAFKEITKRGFNIRKQIDQIYKSMPAGKDRQKALKPLEEAAAGLEAAREFYKRGPGNLFKLLNSEKQQGYIDRARKRRPDTKDPKKLEAAATDILYEDLYIEDFNMQQVNAEESQGKLKLKNIKTKAEAIKHIQDLIEKRKINPNSKEKLEDALTSIAEGRQNGFNYYDTNGVNWAVSIQENAVKNRRTKTFTHEVGHAVFASKFSGLKTREDKKLLSDMTKATMNYLKIHEADAYTRIQQRVSTYTNERGYDQTDRNEETLAFLLEEMPNINTKTMAPLLNSFLNTAGIRVSTLAETLEWWDDLSSRVAKGELNFRDFKTIDPKDLNLKKSVEETFSDGRGKINVELQKKIGDKKYQPGEIIGRDIGAELLTYAFDNKLFNTFILGNIPNNADPKKYLNDVYSNLYKHMSNFTPILENGKPNIDSLGRPDIYGWVMGQLGFKALDVSKKIFDEGARKAKQTQLDKAKEVKAEEDKKQYLEDEFGKYNEKIGITPELQKILTNAISVVVAKYEKGLKEDLSINKTYPDFIREVNKEIVKNYKDITDWHGSGETYAKFLKENLGAIITKVKTNYLSKNFPEMVDKVIKGQEEKGFQPYSEWKGKTIAREKKSETGRTSGNQLMKKNSEVINKMIDDKGEFINQDIIDLLLSNQNKREGLAKQIAIDASSEIIANDLIQYNINQPKFEGMSNENAENLLSQTPIARRFINNDAAISQGLNDTFGSEVIRQMDMGVRSSVESYRTLSKIANEPAGARLRTQWPTFLEKLDQTNEPGLAFDNSYQESGFTKKQYKKIRGALVSIYNEYYIPYKKKAKSQAVNFREYFQNNFAEFQNKDSATKLLNKLLGEEINWSKEGDKDVRIKTARNSVAEYVIEKTKVDEKIEGKDLDGLKDILDLHIGHMTTASKIGGGRFQNFKNNNDAMKHLVDLVPAISELTWTPGVGQKPPVAKGVLNGKRFTYTIEPKIPQHAEKAIKKYKKLHGKNWETKLEEDSDIESSRMETELRSWLDFLDKQRKEVVINETTKKPLLDKDGNEVTKIDNIDFGLAFINQNSNMGTMLRRSATIRWMFEGKTSDSIVYEHVIPADTVNVNLVDYYLNEDTKLTKDDIDQLFEDYTVAFIPKKMDDIISEFFKNTMPLAWKIGMNPLIARYYNIQHITRKNMYAVKDLTGQYPIIGAGVAVKGQNLRLRGSIEQANRDFVIAMRKSVDLNAKEKGASIIDFDDTLAISDSKVIVKMKDGEVIRWTPAEFAQHAETAADMIAEFDFSEFSKVKGGKRGPFLDKALSLQKKFGSKDMFVLTARPAEASTAIATFLKGVGLNIKEENIIGLEDGRPEAKARHIVKMAADGYNSFLFADDAIQNVKAVSQAIDALDVKGKVYQLRLKHSQESINPETLNQILDDNNQGHDAVKKKNLSDEEAGHYGKRSWWKTLFDLKSKTNAIIVPPSAEDIKGLWNNHIAGKGKKGEADILWFEETIIRPFARAERAIDIAEGHMKDKLLALYSVYGADFIKELKKEGYDGIFTKQDAVRMYIWDKLGYEIPGDQNDIKSAITKLKADQNLMTFAEQLLNDVYGHVSAKYKIDYAQPKKRWKDRGIESDMTSSIKDARKDTHGEFLNNKEKVFTKENMSKIEAIYGTPFIEAMKDLFYRMETGVNRSGAAADDFVFKWLNLGTGNIMFLNIRSALLQTISFINFIDILGDNNPVAAATKFFGGLKSGQFVKDFKMIYNSPFLKARRSRGKMDLAMNEVIEGVDPSKPFSFFGLSKRMQEIGYKPTKFGDSFAIALGGATFYRNRFETYIDLGKSKTESHNTAMRDLRERAEETQQSSRADLISKQQAGMWGRVLLSFQNVTMQYTRLSKKMLVDIKNGRRVKKPGGGYHSPGRSKAIQIGRIVNLLGIQGVLFHGLQAAIIPALFASIASGDDETTESKSYALLWRILDGMMKGMGIAGHTLATIRSVATEISRGEKYNAENAIMDISPPLKSKYTKAKKVVKAAGKLDKGGLVDIAIQGPSLVWGIPTDRLVKLADQIGVFVDLYGRDYEALERAMISLGWNHGDFYGYKGRQPVGIIDLMEDMINGSGTGVLTEEQRAELDDRMRKFEAEYKKEGKWEKADKKLEAMWKREEEKREKMLKDQE
jgi:hypothetical protein